MSAVTGFFDWWGRELRDLVPGRSVPAARSGPQLVLSLGEDGVDVLHEQRGKRRVLDSVACDVKGGEFGPVAEALAALRSGGGRSLPIGIRVASRHCFTRLVELPAAGARDFSRMLALDLARVLPFKAGEFHSAHLVDGPRTAAGMVRVRHLVLKARTIAPLVEAIAADGAAPAFVDCWNDDGTAGLAIDFLAAEESTASGRAGWQAALVAGLACAMVVSAVAIAAAKLGSALDHVQAETSRLKGQATAAQRSIERSTTILAEHDAMVRLRAERPPAAEVLEEVTRLLPDTAWLVTFRIDSDTLDISGLAVAASELLAKFERSKLFRDARFTAPLATDQKDDRERFSLRAQIRHAAAPPAKQERQRP